MKVKNDQCSKFKFNLNCKIYCDDHSSLSSTTAVQNNMNYFMYTSHNNNNNNNDDDDDNIHFKQGNGLCISAVPPCTNICKHSPPAFHVSEL